MPPEQATHDTVRDYYGSQLSSTADLKTSACCTGDSVPHAHRSILSKISAEILDRFYGCGSPIPPLLDGRVVLDLGCGTGRDVYLASSLVGEHGLVIGVDMTEEQLAVARRHQQSQAEAFGYARSNVEFYHGYIEDLAGVGIADNSVDVVISNCVINLSPEKERVFAEIFRVLKPGGELYFSDVFADRRVPEQVRADPLAYGECLGGALYMQDFRRLLAGVGCPDYRLLKQRTIEIDDAQLAAKVGELSFCSATVRAFKIDGLEDLCEDYGQAVVYRGTVPGQPHTFTLDDHHSFETGRAVSVCGNTAAMLGETRFGEHFTIIGDRSTHYGPFHCAPTVAGRSPDGAACC